MTITRQKRVRVMEMVFLVAVGAAATIVLLPNWRAWLSGGDSGPRRALTRPLRMKVVSPDAFEQLILGLRVHHYRAQPQREASYRDVFYDTENWDLHRRGYSYRFRTRVSGPRAAKYSVQLEQERRFAAEGARKLDITTDLPDPIGDAIVGGAWDRALHAGDGLDAPERLRDLLSELGIPIESVAPRLRAALDRWRFDVTDKGTNWFELDHEIWTFRRFGSTVGGSVATYQDVVIDTRLNREDPELFRRVQTMRDLSGMINGIVPQSLSPFERAVEDLAGEVVRQDAESTKPTR